MKGNTLAATVDSYWSREIERDLTQSCDKSPYTHSKNPKSNDGADINPLLVTELFIGIHNCKIIFSDKEVMANL